MAHPDIPAKFREKWSSPGMLRQVYRSYDGGNEYPLYSILQSAGGVFAIAAYLLRAQRMSESAKSVNLSGFSFLDREDYAALRDARRRKYDGKQQGIDDLCNALKIDADRFGIVWGWGVDDQQPVYRHVLYVDLPRKKQVSFHCAARGAGPDYALPWDGVPNASGDRILGFIASLLSKPGRRRRSGQGSEPLAGTDAAESGR